MKKIIYGFLWIITLQVILFGCSEDDPQLAPAPSANEVTFTFEYDETNPNIVHFTNTSSVGFQAIWDFGTGITATGNEPTAPFPVQGDYNVKLTLLTKGGIVSNTKVVNIAQTNPLMLDIPSYNFLTGGAENVNGKTWIVDKEVKGHLGVGPDGGTWPEWYEAGPFEKEDRNLYDDEMTFNLSGFAYTHTVGNYFYANGGYSSLPGAIQEPGGGDFFVPYTPPANSKWSLTDNGDGTYNLSLTNSEFMGYYHGNSSYLVTFLNENEMHVRSLDPNAGSPCCAWYQKFIRKGYTRPVNPPPYKIEDIEDNFQAASTIVYTNDGGGSLTTFYDNPALGGLNTSSKVALYIKANGSRFANVQINLDYKMDIRTRNKFKMKVFIPSWNDYDAEGGEGWQSYNTLQKMVSVKLQNNELGGNAWQTQREVNFNNLETNKWIELEFDFSAFSDRTDFDKIVIQLGGEAIDAGGIFYIDDFRLL